MPGVRKWRNDAEGWRHEAWSAQQQAGTAATHKVKGIIKSVLHPGDDNPKGFKHLSTNIIRVQVETTDEAIDYSDEVDGWIFPLQNDPQLAGLVSGSDGLVGKQCTICFKLPITGEAFLEATNSYDNTEKKDEKDQKDYLRTKQFKLPLFG